MAQERVSDPLFELAKVGVREGNSLARLPENVKRPTLSLSRQQDTLDDVTDSENLCDLVGTMVAYAAYSSLPENFKSETLAGLNASSEQLFFISHCLKWCAQLSKPPRRYAPFRSRCIVPLMNMPEFSSAFNCAPGSPMNPQNKCTFW
ncbi:hypothetical protein HPB51_005693 [Rhipicephalus microplus]|uniref:Peptidase M13 C-terminal domain-containing protein n=1 Tax=Rhipicephalus microplus TaxID=6941 RepID=A0A9J6EY68_RHIMP|nr:hypothetical protein HPB51_005693 [Rhipicephalus microplus]